MKAPGLPPHPMPDGAPWQFGESMRAGVCPQGAGIGVMLLLPVNRGGGGNLTASLQPTAASAPWEPSPQRAGCYGYTPEGPSLPAPKPLCSPQSLLLYA